MHPLNITSRLLNTASDILPTSRVVLLVGQDMTDFPDEPCSTSPLALALNRVGVALAATTSTCGDESVAVSTDDLKLALSYLASMMEV